MEKMYSDLSDQIKNLDYQIKDLTTDIDIRFKEVNKKLVVIENKLDNNSKSLLDGYNQVYEKQNITDAKVDNVLSELEVQDLRIRQVKHMLKVSQKKIFFKKI